MYRKLKVTVILFALLAVFVSACGAKEEGVTNAPLPSSTPKPPTNTPEPILPPSVEDVWAINYAGWGDSGGVKIEIARVLIGYKDAVEEITGKDFSELDDYMDGWSEIDVVGELIFKVTNDTDVTADVYPDQGTVQIGSEQIELSEYLYFATVGEDVGGEIYPGVTKVGGMWFGIKRTTPGEVTEIIYRASAAWGTDTYDDLGPDYEIVIPVENPGWQDLPDELK